VTKRSLWLALAFVGASDARGPRDKVRAAYNSAEHLPERRKMMQAWADYLDELRDATPANTDSGQSRVLTSAP
jgi:hypothetical protein